jgi:hypothetical protein
MAEHVTPRGYKHYDDGDSWGDAEGNPMNDNFELLDSELQDLFDNKQPLDALLTALSALVMAADRLPYFDGVGSAALTPFSAFARTLLDDADAATARATLGIVGTGGVSSVFGRVGAVVAAAGDYDAFYYTEAEIDAGFYTVAEVDILLAALLADVVDGLTFTGDILVPDDPYGAGWNGSFEVPTKNALYDKIEAISAGAPANHAASHQNGGGDEISVTGLSGLLADPQTPLDHATEHKAGGGDELLTDIVVPLLIGNGTTVIAAGLCGDVEIPCTGDIIAWRLVTCDGTTGDLVVDTWKDSYANFPPTVADTIWGGSKPTLTADEKQEATGLSIAVTAGQWLRFNVDSAATVTLASLNITIHRKL